MDMNNENQPVMDRSTPEPEESRAALVKRWLDDVAAAKKHWKPDYDRMRRNMKFAGGKQWKDQAEDDERYQLNMVQRFLKSSVSTLYAKDPTLVAKRRASLDFAVWDGKPETVQQAQQIINQAQTLTPEEALSPAGQAVIQGVGPANALMQDIQQGMAKRALLDRIGKTLVTVMDYYVDEASPKFTIQMKQMVRRARTTGVGYVSLDFQREMELSEDQNARIADIAEKMALIGRLSADLADGEIDPYSAEKAELEAAVAAIRDQPEKVVREGLVFRFPQATRIIPSISTENLMGWVGAEWVAEEFTMTADRIKEVYGKDVGKNFTGYRTVSGSPEGGDVRRSSKGELARVYVIHDRRSGMELAVCEGYPDFLKEPGAPDVFIEQFFPHFALTFNEVEEEGALFPKSDVELIKHPQMEINRSGEAKRQHRYAARPLYASPDGAFDDEEEMSLAGHAAHDIIKLRGLEKGQKVEELLQPIKKIGIDPNLYEIASEFEAMQRVSGNAEANVGGTSGATATESSIAEQSRQGVFGLDGDDFDDMLTTMFRAASTILLTELDAETVKEIAGTGAVWPELSRQDVAKELWLEIKAGSTGRPNAARDAATFERVYPVLVQVPGISPRWLAQKAISILDDTIDLDDAFIDGLPSIAQLNAMQQPSTGNPATDPAAQGGHGNDPSIASPARDQGQPGFPGAGAGGSAVN